jgi:hypothetical protein
MVEEEDKDKLLMIQIMANDKLDAHIQCHNVLDKEIVVLSEKVNPDTFINQTLLKNKFGTNNHSKPTNAYIQRFSENKEASLVNNDIIFIENS